MQNLQDIVHWAQSEFAELLLRAQSKAPLNVDQYQRFLSMQYHLTNGVQVYFYTAAAHRDLVRKKVLRRFLVNFANEEEQHYLVAAKDLAAMQLPVLPEPLDVTLWHAYFRSVVADRPFLRLGAACVLENLSSGVAREATQVAMRSSFLNASNTKFLVLHQHEAVPHGDQIVAALQSADLDTAHTQDLINGALRATVMYLRMVEWSLFPQTLAAQVDARSPVFASSLEIADIEDFSSQAKPNDAGGNPCDDQS